MGGAIITHHPDLAVPEDQYLPTRDTPAGRARRVLIVEDDAELANQMAEFLKDNCYEAFIAHSARAADDLLRKCGFDLAIVDVGLPGESGLSFCKRMASPEKPAIIIVSAAGEEPDRILGLELGADDYLAKPFGPRELLARVKAVLRRCAAEHERRSDSTQSVRLGSYVLNPIQRRLRTPDGVEVQLTLGEVTLLMMLAGRPGASIARHASAEHVRSSRPRRRSLDAQICRLRRKLDAFGISDLIQTRRGKGYALNLE